MRFILLLSCITVANVMGHSISKADIQKLQEIKLELKTAI